MARHGRAVLATMLVLSVALPSCEGTMGSGELPAGPDRDAGSDDDGGLHGGGDDTVVGPRCVDLDGDTYGTGCDRGPDCDDDDPSRHDQCTAIELGEGGEAWDPTDLNSSGVTVDREGNLLLVGHPDIEPAVWTANSVEGTVSRIDPSTGDEVGRYPSALAGEGNGAFPWDVRCNTTATPRQGNCPSRTAVDFRGDAYVANRAYDTQGTLTKISSRIEDCVDRDGDGEIQTSHDVDGDGVIDIADPQEFPAEADECVLWTIDVARPAGIPRALAVTPDPRGECGAGTLWVGAHRHMEFYEVSPCTGEVLGDAIVVPISPYGALGSKNPPFVWMVSNNPSASIAAFDYRTREVTEAFVVPDGLMPGFDPGTYGLAMDEGGRPWVASNKCLGAYRYDPAEAVWTAYPLGGAGVSRGIVVGHDGTVWVAHSRCGDAVCGRVTRLDPATGAYVTHDLDSADRPDPVRGVVGVDIIPLGDRDRYWVWAVGQGTDGLGRAARIDSGSDEVITATIGVGPYTYSDFTGYATRIQFPVGYYRTREQACEGARWLELAWEGGTPGDTYVELRLRVAASEAGLASADWIGPFTESPVDLRALEPPVPDGAFVEIELTMRSEDEIAIPWVRSIRVDYQCPIS